jgi:hypothetical protein
MRMRQLEDHWRVGAAYVLQRESCTASVSLAAPRTQRALHLEE